MLFFHHFSLFLSFFPRLFPYAVLLSDLVPPVSVESPKISSVNLRSRSQPCDFRICTFTMFAHTCNDRKTCYTTMQWLLMPIYFGVFVHRMQIWSLSLQIMPKFCASSSDFQKMENPTPSPQIVMRRGKAKAEVTLWDLSYDYIKSTRVDNHMNVSLNILEHCRFLITWLLSYSQ